MNSISIATFILFYNKPAMTSRCLRSVLSSVSAAETNSAVGFSQVCLVDNGSDPTALATLENEVLAKPRNKLLRKPQSPDPQLSWIRLEKNSGFAAGMNAGLRDQFKQGADFVVALSNDIELPADFHANLAGFLKARDPSPSVIICPSVFHLQNRDKPSFNLGRFNPDTRELTHEIDPAAREIRFPEYYPAAATVWSAEAHRKLGGFDESFFCYWEDVDLSHRASTAGVPLLATPRLKVFHQGRGTTAGKAVYREHFLRGRKLCESRIARNERVC